MPLAARTATSHAGADTSPDAPPARIHAGWFALADGASLALVTAPAPFFHDKLIGGGTWLAGQVTDLLGHHHVATGTEQEIPEALEMPQQVVAAIPTYIVLMWVTLLALRTVHRSPSVEVTS